MFLGIFFLWKIHMLLSLLFLFSNPDFSNIFPLLSKAEEGFSLIKRI